MNAVNSGDDIRILLHECGHAFHEAASLKLPYAEMRHYPTEFAEVASFGMELLAAPYLTSDHGGYLSEVEAARWRIDLLEATIQFWPYMAMVDAFQLWAYKGDNEAADPAACDAKWLELKARFEPDIDYSGYQDYKATGWHRKLHIHHVPLYYIEYGLARLGAVQVWANSVRDYAGAVQSYKHGLSLGGTRTLPELFAATGANFAFDTPMVGGLVALIESTIAGLEG
jgi:oligoendopeptidase F